MRFVTALQVEDIFSLEMPLSKPIGNQAPATSALTSFVTLAKPPLSHDATYQYLPVGGFFRVRWLSEDPCTNG